MSAPSDTVDVEVESYAAAPPGQVVLGDEPIALAKGANGNVLEDVLGVDALHSAGAERGGGPGPRPWPGRVEVDCLPDDATPVDALSQCHPPRRFAV